MSLVPVVGQSPLQHGKECLSLPGSHADCLQTHPEFLSTPVGDYWHLTIGTAIRNVKCGIGIKNGKHTDRISWELTVVAGQYNSCHGVWEVATMIQNGGVSVGRGWLHWECPGEKSTFGCAGPRGNKPHPLTAVQTVFVQSVSHRAVDSDPQR